MSGKDTGSFMKFMTANSPDAFSSSSSASSVVSKKVKAGSTKKQRNIPSNLLTQGEQLESRREINIPRAPQKLKTKEKNLNLSSEKINPKSLRVSENSTADRHSRSLPPGKSSPLVTNNNNKKSKSLPKSKPNKSFTKVYETHYAKSPTRVPIKAPMINQILPPKRKIFISPTLTSGNKPAAELKSPENSKRFSTIKDKKLSPPVSFDSKSPENSRRFSTNKDKSLSPPVTFDSTKIPHSKQTNTNILVKPHNLPNNDIKDSREVNRLTKEKNIGEVSFRIHPDDDESFKFPNLKETHIGNKNHFWNFNEENQ
ncbi:expressed protein [Phakopsora pachyrhizi]|uniref:Expressed protein n=1 Tax=Phakopsora pachyrhizi TaxID=170000 RepID=A0AAV0AZZ4_PHAPC|nr:expressed protein [Phakopsora pachyrhizi]